MRRVLFIGAHFDDIEVGCGGTLLKHLIAGDKAFLFITRPDEYRTGPPDIREEEQNKAIYYMRQFGDVSRVVSPPLMESNTMSKNYYDDIFSTLVKDLDELKPDIVFTHWKNDTHQHHREAYKLGLSIGRSPQVFTFFYNSGSCCGFIPNCFSRINMTLKETLIGYYQTQQDHINLDVMKTENRYFASFITNDSDFAEGFISNKMLYHIVRSYKMWDVAYD